MRGLVVTFFRPLTRRRHQAQRTQNTAALITQYVAKHIFHYHDIKLSRVEAQLRRRCIDQNMFDLYLRIFHSNFFQHLIPQHTGLQNIALVNIVQYFFAAHR